MLKQLPTAINAFVAKSIPSPLIKSIHTKTNDIVISYMILALCPISLSAFKQIDLLNLKKGWFTICNSYVDINQYN